MTKPRTFSRVLVRIDMGDLGTVVVDRPRATAQTRFISSIPCMFAVLVGKPIDGVVSGDVSVKEVEACVDFLAAHIRSVEGNDDINWSDLTEEDHVAWVDSMGNDGVASMLVEVLLALFEKKEDEADPNGEG